MSKVYKVRIVLDIHDNTLDTKEDKLLAPWIVISSYDRLPPCKKLDTFKYSIFESSANRGSIDLEAWFKEEPTNETIEKCYNKFVEDTNRVCTNVLEALNKTPEQMPIYKYH